MLRHAGVWATAGIMDKAANYFKNQTPKNEEMLLKACNKMCAKLFRKMGPEAKALIGDKSLLFNGKTVLDDASREVFAAVMKNWEFLPVDWVSKGLGISAILSFSGWATAAHASMEKGSAGMVFFGIAIVTVTVATVSTLKELNSIACQIMEIAQAKAEMGVAAAGLGNQPASTLAFPHGKRNNAELQLSEE